MEIPEVPQSIPREKVVQFFIDLGIDPKFCTSIELRQSGIYAETFARSAEGYKLITNDGPALHKVFIAFD